MSSTFAQLSQAGVEPQRCARAVHIPRSVALVSMKASIRVALSDGLVRQMSTNRRPSLLANTAMGTPGALARDHPVRLGVDHAVDAGFGPNGGTHASPKSHVARVRANVRRGWICRVDNVTLSIAMNISGCCGRSPVSSATNFGYGCFSRPRARECGLDQRLDQASLASPFRPCR